MEKIITTNCFGKVKCLQSKTVNNKPCIDVIDFESDEFLGELPEYYLSEITDEDLIDLIDEYV